MKQVVIATFAFSTLSLVACSPSADEPVSEETVASAPANSSATPAAAPTLETRAVSAIPDQFVGVWDAVGGSCDESSEMRLEVSQQRLEFYESVGEIRSVSMEGDYPIVQMAMTGEGESWDEARRLFIDNSGYLHLTEPGSNRAVTDTPRARCQTA